MNIYDIAREAEVSISTVSKYLNNKNIRPELRERIEKVINKYEYVPSAVARGLVSKSLKVIAVMVVDIQISHYAAAAYAIDNTLSPLGYRVIICNTLGNVNNCIRYLENLLTLKVDGIIFIGSIFNFLNSHPKILKKLDHIPIICNNGYLNTKLCYSVYVDDKHGVYNAVKYLLNKGRKNIVYVKYLETDSSNLKYSGYCEALEEAGLKPVVYRTMNLMSGGYEAIDKMLEEKQEVDAIMCGEDVLALACIAGLSSRGIKVGQDVDVIGFNASQFTTLSNPNMTSVDNKIEETAKASALMLLDIFNNKEVKSTSYDCELVIKQSA